MRSFSASSTPAPPRCAPSIPIWLSCSGRITSTGFFYELMPAFCIGTAAEGTNDWRLEGGALRVPRELALSCIRYLQSRDFDVAISHQMKVDHGITIPLFKLTGALARY